MASSLLNIHLKVLNSFMSTASWWPDCWPLHVETRQRMAAAPKSERQETLPPFPHPRTWQKCSALLWKHWSQWLIAPSSFAVGPEHMLMSKSALAALPRASITDFLWAMATGQEAKARAAVQAFAYVTLSKSHRFRIEKRVRARSGCPT